MYSRSYHLSFRGVYHAIVKFGHDHAFPFLSQEIDASKDFASSEEKRKNAGDKERTNASLVGKLSFGRMEKEFFCGVEKGSVFEQRSLTAMKKNDVERIWENDADRMGKQTYRKHH